MKVLILYQFLNHNQLIKSLCCNLNQSKIEADSFNVATWDFYSLSKTERPFLLKLLQPLLCVPLVKRVISRLFRNYIISLLVQNYSSVDIHFFSPLYDTLICDLYRKKIPVKVTIWGSDFYRADDFRREQQRLVYKKVSIIQVATEQIKNDFLKIYPEYETKVRIGQFGIDLFNVINSLEINGSKDTYKQDLGLPINKTLVLCGTNGSEGQQHEQIFESIQKLQPNLKRDLYLIIPMTYGASKQYTNHIKTLLNNLGLPFKIYTQTLSVNEIGKLRLVSNIAISIQKTDAFSAAIQEHLYCGGILIAGDWLPYDGLKEKGVFFISSDVSALSSSIENVVSNYDSIKERCIGNKDKMKKISSWESSIINLTKNYNELYK